jgi:hypothetical protein
MYKQLKMYIYLTQYTGWSLDCPLVNSTELVDFPLPSYLVLPIIELLYLLHVDKLGSLLSGKPTLKLPRDRQQVLGV